MKDGSCPPQAMKRLPISFMPHDCFPVYLQALQSTLGLRCHLHHHTAGGFGCHSSRLIFTHLFTQEFSEDVFFDTTELHSKNA